MSTVGEKILELSTIDSPDSVRNHLLSAVREVNAIIDAEATIGTPTIETSARVESTSIEVTVQVCECS